MNAQEILAALARHVWTSTIFLLIILALIVLMRNRLTAAARFALALVGIVKFAVPDALIAAPIRRLVAPDAGGVVLEVPLQALSGALTIQPPAMPGSVWPQVAVAIWLAIAIFLAVRSAVTRHRLVALAVRTALPPDPREAEALTRARGRIGVRRAIDVARCALPEAPAVLRIVRPFVALPLRGCDDLSDAELQSLLSHECAHVARHDNLVARIESLIVALFWFHPLIWIAQRITVIERERACDEAVAGSDAERETYLAALAKFCHAAIAPRLPGVSCMATARLKERMDHVMKYPELKPHGPSARQIGWIGAVALALFTVGSGLVAEGALAGEKKKERYAVRIDAFQTGSAITLRSTVRDNETGDVVNDGTLKLDESRRGSARTSGADDLEVTIDARPGNANAVEAIVTIVHAGRIVQRQEMSMIPRAARAEKREKYTGEPISLQLKDADLRDVIVMFGKVTGLAVKIDESVSGRVDVNWRNVPWDEAFDTLLAENGLTYKIEGKAIHVSKK